MILFPCLLPTTNTFHCSSGKPGREQCINCITTIKVIFFPYSVFNLQGSGNWKNLLHLHFPSENSRAPLWSFRVMRTTFAHRTLCGNCIQWYLTTNHMQPSFLFELTFAGICHLPGSCICLVISRVFYLDWIGCAFPSKLQSLCAVLHRWMFNAINMICPQ